MLRVVKDLDVVDVVDVATSRASGTTRTLFLALLFATPAYAQDTDATLARAQRAYDAMRTLRAEFTQTLGNPMLGAPERSRGTMFLAPPGRFAMRFTDPAGDRIVADGEWMWIYAPSSVPNQVIRQLIPYAGATTPNLFQQFVDQPLTRYTAAYVRADSVAGEPVDVVRLMPRRPGLAFRQATLAVARRDGWPRQLILVEESGQLREFVFHELRANESIPPAELTFSVPRGVKIVTP